MQYKRNVFGERLQRQLAHRVCVILERNPGMLSRDALRQARRELRKEYAALATKRAKRRKQKAAR